MRLDVFRVLVVLCGTLVVGEVIPRPETQHNLNLAEVSLGEVRQWWHMGGAAEVVDDFVRLTPDEQSRVGFVQGREPLKNVGDEWVLEAEVRVSGQGITLFGDGLALWMTKERFRPGPVFGHGEVWNGLGVFFDTYDNTGGRHHHKHPYVSAMVNDGTMHYMHDETGTHSASHSASGCSARLRQYGAEDKVLAFRLVYESRRLTAQVLMGKRGDYKYKAPYEYQDCFTLHDVDIPAGYYLGMSASTGDLTDNHDLLSLRVRGKVGGAERDVPEYIRSAWAVTAGERGDTPPLGPDGKALSELPPHDPDREHVQPNIPATPPQQQQTPQETVSTGQATIERNLGNGDVESQPPTEEEMEEINSFVADTRVVKYIKQQTEGNRHKLQLIHDQLEAKVAALHKHLQDMLESMQAVEDKIEARLAVVEATTSGQVNVMIAESSRTSQQWMWPFIGVLVLISLLSCIAYTRYRRLMKTHML